MKIKIFSIGLFFIFSSTAFAFNVLSSLWKTNEYLGEVTQVTAGYDFTCALISNSRIKCWGKNNYGQLGLGNTTQIGDNETPDSTGYVDVANTSSIIQLNAGKFHICALFSGGGVKCWGRNQFGELSFNATFTPSIGDNETPGDIATPVGSARYVDAGEDHSCIIRNNGDIRCIGGGGGGDLGYGDTSNQNDFTGVGSVGLGSKAIQIGLGDDFTCAVNDSYQVYCWGGNASGRLGLSTTSSGFNTPQGPLNIGEDVLEVDLGLYHACALLANGKVRCWGDNTYGQLGYANTATVTDVGDDEHPSSMGDVNLGIDAIQITTGQNHSCALLANHKVICWGQNDHGQLGYGNTTTIGDDEAPSSAGYVQLPESAIQIDAGYRHTCAVLISGTVRCWGYGGNGNLGYGNGTATLGDDEAITNLGPVKIEKATSEIKDIAAGDNFSCYLETNGNARCWGKNNLGQLGLGNTTTVGDDEGPKSVSHVRLGKKVVKITAGKEHACAILEGGLVKCWGSNSDGKLGLANTATVAAIGDDETPENINPINLGGLAKDISAGSDFTCALLSDGKVRCWGDGSNGKLGYSNTNTIGDGEHPSTAGDVDVGENVVKLSAGDQHVCVLTSKGNIRCWGSNLDGRLGYANSSTVSAIGDDEHPSTAGDVTHNYQMIDVSASKGAHSCSVASNGLALCWGKNDQGQLGYGNTTTVGDDETPASAGSISVTTGGGIQISTGVDHTCYRSAAGGIISCWGKNDLGQLGYGNTASEPQIGNDETPSTIGNIPFSSGFDVKTLSLGYDHTCVLFSKGNPRCWGNNTNGQLGLANTTTYGDDETADVPSDVERR